MKRCLYCLLPHERRGRCCCEWCARKVNGRASWVSRSRKLAITRRMQAEQKANQYRRRWRDVAMGRDDSGNLTAIFGHQLDVFAALGTRGPVLSDDD